MRDRTAWRRTPMKELRKAVGNDALGMEAGVLLDVELGIHLLTRICPEEPASVAHELLSGYPWPQGLGLDVGAENDQAIRVARHLLAPFRARRDWETRLRQYKEVPEHFRGFLVDGDGRVVRRRPSVASNRFDVFDKALATDPPLRRTPARGGGAGTYTVTGTGHPVSVKIPEDIVSDDQPAGHDLSLRLGRRETEFQRLELVRTAHWLDEREQKVLPADERRGWSDVIDRIRPQWRKNGAFVDRDAFTVTDVLHMIGMVGAGKSTFMLLLAACAARRGEHVTLVVGDVLAALRHVAWFNKVALGDFTAAPIVGASSHVRHINRMHRVHASGFEHGPQLTGFGDENHFLSTACALDGLRTDAQPWGFREAPCRDRLIPTTPNHDDDRQQFHDCPLWNRCQRHRSSRDLVDASVWVTTAPGLLHSRVPRELNADQLRYLELVWRRSDLVIVDEADQVQTQLDSMFSPGQTLFGDDQEAWLELLADHTERELRGRNRAQFANRPVREWISNLDTARACANRLYTLLQRNPLPRGGSTLKRWIKRDCFTEWTLADKLVRAWSHAAEPDRDNPRYAALREAFDAFLPDPLGIRGRAEGIPIAVGMVELTRALLSVADEDERGRRVQRWLNDLEHQLPPYDDQKDDAETDWGAQLEEHALRAEFTMQLAVLSNVLNALTRMWRTVEEPLRFDSANGLIFQRPPEDYTPVVPSPPMGAILGFQYNESGDNNAGGMGQLRFFRCAGVGRWALLNLHRLFAVDDETGPAVLLLSGTSWAGTSPRYDIQLPVDAVLPAPSTELEGIDQSVFLRSTVEENGKTVEVSGETGDRRRAALHTILRKLAIRPRSDRPSKLEAELNLLEPDRRRILLIVGSYAEAREVADYLVETRRDWRGQVRHLVADDSEYTTHWEPTLRRGDVHRFAETGARFLVAPLLAVERGHNILNDDNRAAIGSVYFLVRPHPRPDDITYIVQMMNRWAADVVHRIGAGAHGYPNESLHALVRAVRSAGYRRWQRMLTVPLAYGSLDETHDRPALAWTQLVTIWQVIGRLVRGGCAARVHFCDGKFFARPGEDPQTSLVVGMRDALAEYLTPDARCDPIEAEIAENLYGPLYRGLGRLLGEH
ncbi:hypothetical protein GCM10027570_37270 [Streptomonospora sediminis]